MIELMFKNGLKEEIFFVALARLIMFLQGLYLITASSSIVSGDHSYLWFLGFMS